jgi:hypothetical protein
MEENKNSKVRSADVAKEGVIITFADGTTLFYSQPLLVSMIPEAQLMTEPEPDEQ